LGRGVELLVGQRLDLAVARVLDMDRAGGQPAGPVGGLCGIDVLDDRAVALDGEVGGDLEARVVGNLLLPPGARTRGDVLKVGLDTDGVDHDADNLAVAAGAADRAGDPVVQGGISGHGGWTPGRGAGPTWPGLRRPAACRGATIPRSPSRCRVNT